MYYTILYYKHDPGLLSRQTSTGQSRILSNKLSSKSRRSKGSKHPYRAASQAEAATTINDPGNHTAYIYTQMYTTSMMLLVVRLMSCMKVEMILGSANAIQSPRVPSKDRTAAPPHGSPTTHIQQDQPPRVQESTTHTVPPFLVCVCLPVYRPAIQITSYYLSCQHDSIKLAHHHMHDPVNTLDVSLASHTSHHRASPRVEKRKLLA